MTSVGLKDNKVPFPNKIDTIIDNAKICIDVIYNQETTFLQKAKDKNKIIFDGKNLLLSQAILSFEYFTDFKIDRKDIENAIKNKDIL